MKLTKLKCVLNLSFVSILLLVAVKCFTQKNTNKKPNFVVILTDDQSWVGTSFLLTQTINVPKVIIIKLQTWSAWLIME